jgi:hypothetical protein
MAPVTPTPTPTPTPTSVPTGTTQASEQPTPSSTPSLPNISLPDDQNPGGGSLMPDKDNPKTGSASELTYFNVFILLVITVLGFFLFKELEGERDNR